MRRETVCRYTGNSGSVWWSACCRAVICDLPDQEHDQPAQAGVDPVRDLVDMRIS